MGKMERERRVDRDWVSIRDGTVNSSTGGEVWRRGRRAWMVVVDVFESWLVVCKGLLLRSTLTGV